MTCSYLRRCKSAVRHLKSVPFIRIYTRVTASARSSLSGQANRILTLAVEADVPVASNERSYRSLELNAAAP